MANTWQVIIFTLSLKSFPPKHLISNHNDETMMLSPSATNLLPYQFEMEVLNLIEELREYMI